MPLPDITPLTAAPADELRAWGLRLDEIRRQAGDLPNWGAVASELYYPMRVPLQQWYARQSDNPGAIMTRLFMFEDSVTREEAESALSPEWTRQLLDWNVLEADGDQISSALLLRIYQDVYIFCDDIRNGGDAVMGSGDTTRRLTEVCLPPKHVGSLLELGCGAAPAALLGAALADHVVGTDINARAVEMSAVNAAMNGITNAEFRVGSLYEPVAGERFDWILSQPPYLPRPAAAREASYLFGGERGDELPKAVVEGAAAHLTPDGRALISIDWPVVDGDPILERAAAVLPENASLLQLAADHVSADAPASAYSAHEDPTIREDYAKSVFRWRDHFAAHGIKGVQPTLNVVALGSPQPFRDRSELDAPFRSLSPARVSSLFDARELLAAGDDALRAARLRTPDDWVLSREAPLANPQEGVYKVRRRIDEGFAAGSEAEVPENILALIHAVHQSESIESWIASAAPRMGRTPSQLWPEAREFLHTALRSGLLVPRPT